MTKRTVLLFAGCLLGLAAGVKLDANTAEATTTAACPADTGNLSDLNFEAAADGSSWTAACVATSTHWKKLSDESAGPDCLAFNYEGYEADMKTKPFEDIPHLCVGCYALFEIALNPFCIFGPCGGRPFPSNKQWAGYKGNTVQFWWALGICAWTPLEETFVSYFTY